MKHCEIGKTEFVPNSVFNPWNNYSDGLSKFKDRTLIRNRFAWSLKMEEKDIQNYNNKNKKLAKLRKARQNKIQERKL